MPELLRPQSIDEAADLIGKHGAALTILAGGTTVIRDTHPSDDGYVLGVDRLGLDRVVQRGEGWSVGAAVSVSTLRAAVPVPAILTATREVGGPAIQNMATVGGNLFAQRPFGDLGVALLAIGARLTFATPSGEMSQSIDEFYAGWENGAPPRTGLLTRIDLTKPSGTVAYQKCARRRYSSPSVVTVAAQVVKDGSTVSEARIALSGASAHPLRCAAAEAAVTGSSLDEAALTEAAEAAQASVSPKTDPVATEWYRRRMAGVFVRRVLAALA